MGLFHIVLNSLSLWTLEIMIIGLVNIKINCLDVLEMFSFEILSGKDPNKSSFDFDLISARNGKHPTSFVDGRE